MRESNGEVCPGEAQCTSDRTKGRIAGLEGRVQKRTLKNYCHNQTANKDNGLFTGCPLYDTKPENTPATLYGAIEAAEILRGYKQRGVLPPITEMTAWEYSCFETAEEASDLIESEQAKKLQGNQSNGGTEESPLGKTGQQGENSVFKDW